jgi:maltose O-acetyltransferase
MLDWILDKLSALKSKVERKRLERRWYKLRQQGMHLGSDVWLPASTWIDPDYCFLISIGDHCGFGEECLILAHDAQMDEFLDAARIGQVTIHESCHIGARTVILPGVVIGPKTIVGANSVVTRSLPPDTVCAGNPAKVICSLEDYLSKHRSRIVEATKVACVTSDTSLQERQQITVAAKKGSAYVVGGRTAELEGKGGTPRTPHLFSE